MLEAKQMKRKRKVFLVLLIAFVILITGGCSQKVKSDQITQLDRVETTEKKGTSAKKLEKINQIPDDGIITAAQMDTISGEDGQFQFSGKDQDKGITYVWTYEGKRIKNPVDQNLKVEFSDAKIEEVKKAGGNAPYGLAITLQKMNLAAPAALGLTLNEKWDADNAVLCKYVDGEARKVCDVVVGSVSGVGDKALTNLAFNVLEVGDTYYILAGKSKEDNEENKGAEEKTKNNGNNNQQSHEVDNSPTGNNQNDSEQAAETQSGQSSHTCTISIECSTILNNWDDLNEAKADFVPSDGWILYTSEVEYSPGETVYDVLYRVCKDTSIQMSAKYTPAYGSYYVEGINQLYEFDCGELSGWMYSVNGWFPNYGCSQYEVSDGDIIEWRYTCDLGRDVGDQYYE
ncbi:DUF4430 domain-containing protein [Blautia marasmi]|nr:DUF4430 domain-containing protein [Blautia marasmi]